MNITYSEIRKKLNGEHYPMKLAGRDAEVVVKACNQGIDAYLEACNIKGRDSYKWTPTYVGKRKKMLLATHLEASVSPESLPVLLRRLTELPGGDEVVDGDDPDVASSLVTDILEGLGFENVSSFCYRIIPDYEAVVN